MEVVDHEPRCWFLLRDRGALFLDASCEHRAVGYTVLIQLDADEASQYANGGRAYLNQLAQAIHESAPGAIGSRSPYKDRNIMSRAHDVDQAFVIWRANNA